MSRTKKFSLTTTVSIAKTGTHSLRVTIPESMVVFLNLKSGDKLGWTMENKGKKRWSIVTRKQQSPNEVAS